MSAAIDLHFGPDPARARRLSERMRAELGSSLAYLVTACSGHFDFEKTAVSRIAARLQAGAPASPMVFADYYALVEAVSLGQEARARTFFSEIAQASLAHQHLGVVGLGDELGVRRTQTYRAMMAGEPGVSIRLNAPAPDAMDAFRDRFTSAMALLNQGATDLFHEVRALMREVVAVGSDPTDPVFLGGGSHYQLWGALFVNVDHHQTPLALAEVIAHESAHSLLFGFCIDDGLVENEGEALYASPLRSDLRQMDGIYHATFVSARMHQAMSCILAHADLSKADAETARAAIAEDGRNFQAGLAVLREHGRLTPVGRTLMEGATQYIEQAA